MLDKALGLYCPSFYFIELNTDYDFINSDNNRNAQRFGVLLHEYIHFLQDITTTYGQANFSATIERFMAFVYKSYIQTNANIKVPIKLDEFENAETNHDLFSLYRGDNNEIYLHKILSMEIHTKPNGLIETYENAGEIIVYIKTNKEESIEYRLGALGIMESMAHLIETHIYPQNEGIYHLPYNICEIVAEELYPQLLSCKANLVALCDVSLMYYHPGEIFYCLLVKMKSDCFIPKNIEDIYEYAYKTIGPEYLPIFADCHTRSKENINELFKINSLHEGLNKWANDLFDQASYIRTNNKIFISKIMELETEEAIQYALDLMSKFGIPLLIDKRGNTYNGVNKKYIDVDLTIFRAVYALYYIFSDFEFGCNMQTICSNIPGKKIIDERCKLRPWEKCSDKELCPFAQLWKKWGLEGKKIQH